MKRLLCTLFITLIAVASVPAAAQTLRGGAGMTHNTPAPGNVLPPGSKLCAGLWHGADCERRSTCARHTEIDTTPGAVMVFASVCNSLGTLGGYVAAGGARSA